MSPAGPSKRLDASRRTRACLECGQPFTPERDHAEFCCEAHRKAWNNRRATRGAELYDLMMALRHDRSRATKLGVWKIICRLAAMFREEDLAQRAGRKSWRDPKEIIERRPYLVATTLSHNIAGVKR